MIAISESVINNHPINSSIHLNETAQQVQMEHIHLNQFSPFLKWSLIKLFLMEGNAGMNALPLIVTLKSFMLLFKIRWSHLWCHCKHWGNLNGLKGSFRIPVWQCWSELVSLTENKVRKKQKQIETINNVN